jgi:hypothetical protein
VKEYNRHSDEKRRRVLGAHLTSSETFSTYILPEIKDKLNDYLWVDLYAGKGNLIFPILDLILPEKRSLFFADHIFLSDVRNEMVQKSIEKAIAYGISEKVAKNNIQQRNNLETFPVFLKKRKYPVYHITNPPYLYLGYIKKHPETRHYSDYFNGLNNGYQDLYQIAMINDLRNNIDNLIYLIPTNFLFGSSVSNKFRLDFLKYYDVEKMYIFEKQIFEFTGTNILIGFFERKESPSLETVQFQGKKFKKNGNIIQRRYDLIPTYNYRAGSEFNGFLDQYRAKKPINVSYYLQKKEVKNNYGEHEIKVIDTSEYESNEYNIKFLTVNESLKDKVLANQLYVRTVDTGSYDGRVGLYNIQEDFNVEGIFVSGNTYRTSPIQVFLNPSISAEDQALLRRYFNLILEYFRDTLDSEFLTTYKYSNADYTRKYLGLTQTRDLIKTFPILSMQNQNKHTLKTLIEKKSPQKIIEVLK